MRAAYIEADMLLTDCKLGGLTKFHVYFNFQSTSMSLKVGKNVFEFKQLDSRWDAKLIGISSGN